MKSATAPPLLLFNLMLLHATRSWAFSYRAVSTASSRAARGLRTSGSLSDHKVPPYYYYNRPLPTQTSLAMSSSAASSSPPSAPSTISSKSTDVTQATTHEEVATQKVTRELILISGDHAGLSATFSPTTGELIPVPEHLVPQSMIDWGDIPSSLEILTSEELLLANNEFMRTTVTVMPEVGCGIDNLETTKKVERFPLQETRLLVFGKGENADNNDDSNRGVVVIDKRNTMPTYNSDSMRRIELETIFQVDPEVEIINGMEEGEEARSKVYPRRIRLAFSIDIPTTSGKSEQQQPSTMPKIATPITVQIQRRYPHDSVTSTQGTAWTGTSSNSGGLDARTVMNFIGRDITSVNGDVFAVKKRKNGGDCWEEDILEGLDGVSSWKQDGANDVLVERARSEFGLDRDEGDKSIVNVRLPQNILIRYGYGLNSEEKNTWDVEVSKIDTTTNDDEEGIGSLSRRVLLRSFDNSQKEEEAGDGASLCKVVYWSERKI